MADRAKTLWSLMPAVSTITASSELNATWAASKTNDKLVDIPGNANGITWITAIGPTYPVTLQFDFGSAVTFNSCLIAGDYWGDIPTCIRNGGIEYSANGTSWSQPGSGSEFTDLFGAVAPANVQRFAQVTFASATARYWRLRIDSHYPGAANDYTGTQEWFLWNSALIGTRLDNGAGVVLTAPGNTQASASVASDRVYIDGSYGLYYLQAVNAASVVTLDLGSTQYIGGLDVLHYYTGTYGTKDFYLYTSTNGVTYTFAELVSSPPVVQSKIIPILFSRIYSARYLKFFPIAQINGFLWHEWFIYATLTPAVPPNPTDVIASSGTSSGDPSAIHVRWSAAAGDDNALADLVYRVERRVDSGAWSTLTSTHPVTHYVDSGLAAGTYDYRITAINNYHARESSAVQTSAGVVVPAVLASGGKDKTSFVQSYIG